MDVPQAEGPKPVVPDGDGAPDTGPRAEAGSPDQPPATEPDRELAAFVTEQLAGISAQLSGLRAMFEAKASADERQAQWVTQLTSELASYRDDFVFKNVVSKVFDDLINLYDTLDQTLDPAVLAEISREDLLIRLRNVRRQILKTFERQGVEPLESKAQKPFDEAWQEAIDVRPVGQAADHEAVLESVRCGFRYGSRLLRPESVIVGRYEPKDEGQDG
jgi:molecular chaperone GrpE